MTQIELLVGKTTGESIKKLNGVIAILSLSAPDDVLKRISGEVIVNQENIIFDREDFKNLQLILHEDIHGKSQLINKDYFPSFNINKNDKF